MKYAQFNISLSLEERGIMRIPLTLPSPHGTWGEGPAWVERRTTAG